MHRPRISKADLEIFQGDDRAAVRSRPRSAEPAQGFARLLNPVIKAGFTATPEVVYSPNVPAKKFVTNRSDPEIAMPIGPFNPVIRAGFTVAPEVVYSPIVLLLFATNRSDPEIAMPSGCGNPVINAGFTGTPEVVYAPIKPPISAELLRLVTNRSEPETAMPVAVCNLWRGVCSPRRDRTLENGIAIVS
jgi:hypothetical protein